MKSLTQKSPPLLKLSIIGLLALVGVLIYATLWLWAKQYAPPEGHVFQRLPLLTGVYNQEPCNTSRCGRSFLNGERIRCWHIGFFGSRPDACGGSAEYNNQRVSIAQVLVPKFAEGWVPAISSFTSETRQSDIEIRQKWLDITEQTCAAIALVLWLLLTFVYVAMCIQDFIKQSDTCNTAT